MASRRIIAATACLLLSGLVVGGSCASLAFADPGSGNGGSSGGGSNGGSSNGGGSNGGGSNGGGSDGHSRPGFGFGLRPGTPSGGGTSDAPKVGTQSPSGIGVHLPTRPPALIGDGRNGRIGIVPRPGDPAQSGSAAPPSASLPPSTDDEPSTGPSAVPRPVIPPTPTATATGITIAPTSDPTVAPAVPPTGDDDGGTAARSWWSTPRTSQLGLLDDDRHGAVLPSALPQLSGVQLPTALPGEVLAAVGRVADHVTGLATAAAALPFASISLPVVVPPLGAPGAAVPRGGRGAAGEGADPRTPPSASVDRAPSITGTAGAPQDPPRSKESQPVAVGTGAVSEVTYRAGYDDYLRAAGVGKVAAVAVPGVSGILLLTGVGGLIGYRQARAGSAVRSTGPGRFMS